MGDMEEKAMEAELVRFLRDVQGLDDAGMAEYDTSGACRMAAKAWEGPSSYRIDFDHGRGFLKTLLCPDEHMLALNVCDAMRRVGDVSVRAVF